MYYNSDYQSLPSMLWGLVVWVGSKKDSMGGMCYWKTKANQAVLHEVIKR